MRTYQDAYDAKKSKKSKSKDSSKDDRYNTGYSSKEYGTHPRQYDPYNGDDPLKDYDINRDWSCRVRADDFDLKSHYDYRDVSPDNTATESFLGYDPDIGLAVPMILAVTLFFMALVLNDILLHPSVLSPAKRV